MIYDKTQNTVRLSKADIEYINENYLTITDTEERLPFSKFFMLAVTQAVSMTTPKKIEVSKESDINRIKTLEAEVLALKEEKKEYLEKNSDTETSLKNQVITVTQEKEVLNKKVITLQDKLETLENQPKNQIPPDAIVLQFEPKWRKYIWSVLQMSKKIKFANSYEELITTLFKVSNARNELVLDKEDYRYLETIPYDLPETEKEKEKSEKEN